MLMAEVNAVEDNDSVDQVLVSIWSSLSTDGLCGNDIAESLTTQYALYPRSLKVDSYSNITVTARRASLFASFAEQRHISI